MVIKISLVDEGGGGIGTGVVVEDLGLIESTLSVTLPVLVMTEPAVAFVVFVGVVIRVML
jgi:hypothetical protein